MKYQNQILFICLVVLPAMLPAQPGIINTTAAVKADSAILYKEIVNELKVTGLPNTQSLQIRSSLLSIDKSRRPFIYYASARSRGLDTLYLIQSGKILYKKQFTVVDPQPMKAALGTISDSVTTIKQIILNPVLRAVIPDCNCFSRHFIGHFTIKFQSTHLEAWEKEYSISGSKLDNVTAIIKRLQPNDRILFENITTIDIDSYPVKLPAFSITIK